MTPEDNREHRPKRDPNLKLLSDFITSVREQGDDGTPNMPPSVPRISGAQAADMAEFEQVLLDEEPVDWRSSEGSEISVSLLGFRYLHEALLVRSLLADQRGDRIARDRAIDAAWLLEESMQRRPVVIDRLLVYVAASSRNACLRRFRSGPADWASRIRPEERLLSLVDCFQNEALVVCRSSHRLMGLADANSLFGDKLPRVGPGGWVLRVATAPLLRLGVASYANLLRLETEALRRGNPCTIDREAYDEGVTSSLPRWNVVARAAAPLLAAWWTARDAALNDELTLAVLAQRDTGAGPGWTRASSVCQGLSWRSDPSPRGGVTVRAIGDRTAELDASKPGLSYALTGR